MRADANRFVVSHLPWRQRYGLQRTEPATERTVSSARPLGFAEPPEERSISYDEEALRHFEQDL